MSRRARRFAPARLAKSAAASYPFSMLDRADSPGIQSLRPPCRRRSRPGRARKIFRKRGRSRRFSPAPRSPASTRSSAQNPPWAGVLAPASGARRRRRQRAPSRPRRGRGALTRRVPPRRPGGEPGPAGKLLLAWRELVARRPGVAVGRSKSPPRSWGRHMTRRCKPRSRPPRPAPSARLLAPFAAAQAYRLACRALTPGAGRQCGEGRANSRGLARRRRARAEAQMAVCPALTGRAAVFARWAARRRPRRSCRGRGAATRILIAYAQAAARAGDLAADIGAARAKAARGRSRNCAPRGRGRRCRRCSTRIPRTPPTKIGGHFRARSAKTVRAAGRARRAARTDRARDVPAVRAVSDGADPEA